MVSKVRGLSAETGGRTWIIIGEWGFFRTGAGFGR